MRKQLYPLLTLIIAFPVKSASAASVFHCEVVAEIGLIGATDQVHSISSYRVENSFPANLGSKWERCRLEYNEQYIETNAIWRVVAAVTSGDTQTQSAICAMGGSLNAVTLKVRPHSKNRFKSYTYSVDRPICDYAASCDHLGSGWYLDGAGRCAKGIAPINAPNEEFLFGEPPEGTYIFEGNLYRVEAPEFDQASPIQFSDPITFP